MRRLVIRPGAIGDFIVSLPAIHALHTDYLEVWVPSRHIPLVRFAHRVRSIVSTGLDLAGIADTPPSLLAELRTFDSIVSWYGANRPEFRDFCNTHHLPVRFHTALPTQGASQHATDFYLDQIHDLAPPTVDPVPRIECDVPRANYAVIQPFSGSPRKNWPLDNFRRLAHELERTMPVHWCSGLDDPPLPHAVRIDDLYQLARWLAAARLYCGNDSGITHLAAAVDTPTLAFFGPTDPAIWAPRGPYVQIVQWKPIANLDSELQ